MAVAEDLLKVKHLVLVFRDIYFGEQKVLKKSNEKHPQYCFLESLKKFIK